MPLTMQQMLDRAEQHARSNPPSYYLDGEGTYAVARCRYRGPDGNKCLIGIFIPDDLYRPHLEGSAAGHLVVEQGFEFLVPTDEGVPYDDRLNFVADLQAAHDNAVFLARKEAQRKHMGRTTDDEELLKVLYHDLITTELQAVAEKYSEYGLTMPTRTIN